MSHFTVMVIGEDVDGQLEPFDEAIEVEPYRAYWDSEEIRSWERVLSESGESDYSVEAGTVLPELPEGERHELAEVARAYNARWGDEGDPLAVDDGGIYRMSTYNPRAKWDWYEVGGRWRGYFKLREGAAAAVVGGPGAGGNEPLNDSDVVLRGDVDAEAMRAEAGRLAGDRWDLAQELLAHLDEAESWSAVLARHAPADGSRPDAVAANAARREYHEQPRVEAARRHDEACLREGREGEVIVGWGGGVEDFQVSREEYVQAARDEALAPYAYVHEGEWHAPGRMVWFGMSDDDETSRRAFAREFNELFDRLPDDEVLTLVDCHI